MNNQTERTISSARLLVCVLPGQRSEIFLHAFSELDPCGRENTHRGSLGPHHTPMPATDPGCPLFEHAPSVYTTFPNPVDDDDEADFDGPALALSGALDLPATGDESDPNPAMGVGVGVDVGKLESTPFIQPSASSRVLIFLYTARG